MQKFSLTFLTDEYKTTFNYEDGKISSHKLPPDISQILSHTVQQIEWYYQNLPPKLIEHKEDEKVLTESPTDLEPTV